MSRYVDFYLIGELVDSHGNVHYEDLKNSRQPMWLRSRGVRIVQGNLFVITAMIITVQTEKGEKMSDLISRQAAIDAINQICPIDTEYDCTLLDRVDVRCVLTDLPSAQPEIIRCKDCKYWREDHTCKEHSLVSPMLANDFCSRAERREDDKG